MKIFVAGVVGRRLMPMLMQRGHTVFATTRAATKAAALKTFGAEPIVVDALDRSAVICAIEATPAT